MMRAPGELQCEFKSAPIFLNLQLYSIYCEQDAKSLTELKPSLSHRKIIEIDCHCRYNLQIHNPQYLPETATLHSRKKTISVVLHRAKKKI